MARLQVTYRKIGSITPYENNPRHNDEAAEAVAESIREFGFQNPIILDEDGVILCGHTRLKAAKLLELAEVPTVTAAGLTEDQKRAYRLADNKTGELSGWDFDKLAVELETIELDMEPFGFDGCEFESSGCPGSIDAGFDGGQESYREQYGVIVVCSDEAEQQEVYERLSADGLTCKVVAV